jgi:microcystin-dependent protein
MALPAATDFTGSSITEAQFKSAITDLRNYIADIETVAPGIVAYYPASSPPTGWLKANGAAISRTTYAALFAAIGVTFGAGNGSTTFNVPDLRGEFIRGLDDGRGVDAGRVLGAAQADMFKSHSHNITAYPQAGTGAKISAGSSTSVTGTASTTSAGGAETRPRNVALLACIKY